MVEIQAPPNQHEIEHEDSLAVQPEIAIRGKRYTPLSEEHEDIIRYIVTSELESRYTIDADNAAVITDTDVREAKNLGEGNDSFVCRGFDTHLNKPVIIKVQKENSDNPNDMKKDLRRLTSLRHNNIVKIYDHLTIETPQGNREALVLEELKPLEEQLSYDEAIQMAYEIGDALDYLNEQQIAHTDVWAPNILRRDNGDFVLIDFGFSLSPEDVPYPLDNELLSDQQGLARAWYEVVTGTYAPEDEPLEPGKLESVYGIPQRIGAILFRVTSSEKAEYPDCKALARALQEAVAACKQEGSLKPVPQKEPEDLEWFKSG